MSELAKLTEREINGLRADLLHNAHSLRHGIPIDPKDINALCDMALKAAALERGVWVPVSERLPDQTEVYITAFGNKGVWLSVFNIDKQRWFPCVAYDPTVTHWMPLPAAPVSYDEGRRD
jgi:hypothetical protein